MLERHPGRHHKPEAERLLLLRSLRISLSEPRAGTRTRTRTQMRISYFPGPVMEGFVPYIFFSYSVLHIERKTIVDTRALDSTSSKRPIHSAGDRTAAGSAPRIPRGQLVDVQQIIIGYLFFFFDPLFVCVCPVHEPDLNIVWAS